MYSIFSLAVWFSTDFWGTIMDKTRAFPRNIPNFGKLVVLFTPNSQCWKSKWKIKAHEARNSFCYLSLNMFIKKNRTVTRCLFHPSMEKGLLGSLTLINFLILVWGEINFVSEFCILQESFENVIPFDGGERANYFDILYFHLYKDEYPQGWRRIIFIIFWISGILCFTRARVFKLSVW